MPTLDDWLTIKAALTRDVKAAWPSVKKVHFKQPALPLTEVPYAVCFMGDVEGEFATVRNVHQTWDFTVYLVEQLPPGDVDPVDLKVQRYGELALVLEANETYEGIGMLPIVHTAGLNESPGDIAGTFALSVGFRFLVDRAWGT